MLSNFQNNYGNLNFIQNIDLSLLNSSGNKENSESLLRKKRNFHFKIEKNIEKKSSLRQENSTEAVQPAAELFKNNFSSTTNLSKESSEKANSRKSKKENEIRKIILEKNLFNLYSINNLTAEEKEKLACKDPKISEFARKEYLKQIKTKNNFITLNKHLSSDINFAKINFTIPNFSSDCLKLTKNEINNRKIFNTQINKHPKYNNKLNNNLNLANNSDCSFTSELNEKSLYKNKPNCDSKNLGLFINQSNQSEKKTNNNNNLANFNKVNNFKQTASSSSSELENFTYLNLNLFDKSELYSERIENIQSFLNKKAKEKVIDEKTYLLHFKNIKELNEANEETKKMEDYSLDVNNLANLNLKNEIALKEKVLDTISHYECVFSNCEKILVTRKEWDAHYQEHYKN